MRIYILRYNFTVILSRKFFFRKSRSPFVMPIASAINEVQIIIASVCAEEIPKSYLVLPTA